MQYHQPDAESALHVAAGLPPKLTRPQLRGACARQRLFRLLERELARASLWIQAGPGSGKTVLASSCMDAGAKPCFWYRVDPRDRYPATLFHYLRCAALATGDPRAGELPHLTPEYLGGIESFAHQFFETFFACLQPGTVLVFDDCHELGEQSPAAPLLAAGIERAPPSLRFLLISRYAPGPAFTRLCVAETLRVIDHSALMLDEEEARAIARRRFGKGVSRERIALLHREARGWVAGFCLLLEQCAGRTRGPDAVPPRLRGYLSAEVLSRLDARTVDALVQTAWLPRVSAQSITGLCGDADAALRIEDLCRRSFFVSASGGAAPVYEYHPLLRQCLMQHARETWPRQRLEEVRGRAASQLIATGQHEDALDLLLENRDWVRAARLIAGQARGWLAQGRRQIVESALQAMPGDEVARRPGLLYWKGVCRMPFDPVAARRLLLAAEQGFAAAGDQAGQWLACITILESHFHERADFHPLDPWIAKAEALVATHPEVMHDGACASRGVAAMFCAYMIRAPGSPELWHWMERAETLAMQAGRDASILGVATQLVAFHAWWTGDTARAEALVDALEPSQQSLNVEPLERIAWTAAGAIHRACVLDHAGCIAAAQRGLRIGRACGVHLWDFLLLAQCGWGSIFRGDEAAAEKYLRRMAAALQSGHHLDACQYHFQRFILAMHRDDFAAMDVHARATWEQAHASGNPWTEALGLIARARVAVDDPPAAERLLDEAAACIDGPAGNTMLHAVLLARAELAFDAAGPQAGLDALTAFMAFSSERNILHSFWIRDDVLAELCVRALEHGIETAFVRRLVRARRLRPARPPLHVENWPWAIDIDTLGRFEVRVDGVPLRFARKSQKRPLALLKAIIAHGGEGVPEDRLADALWPDSDGDAGHQALAITLHRLRQLIGADVVVRRNGTLTLDPARCRVDLWTCERRLSEIERALPAGFEPSAGLLQEVVQAYRGPFLQGEGDAPWVLPTRERLRNRLLRALVATGKALRAHGRFDDAARCYESGLRLDELAEDCYLGLMRCHAARHQAAAGLAVYRRCSEALQRGLGIRPGAEAESLRDGFERPRGMSAASPAIRT